MVSVMDTIIFAVGGTGGHIFPAIALAKKLQSSKIKPIFAGEGLENSDFFKKKDIEFYDIKSAELRLKNPLKTLKAIKAYIQGTRQAIKLIQSVKPKLIVGFGSFHSFPVLLAAFFKNIPYVLYESNSVMGRINRIFSKKAKYCAYELFDLKKKSSTQFVKVKMPPYHQPLTNLKKSEARDYFSLSKDKFTLLVFGGSQGALSFNLLFLKTLKSLKNLDFQVIHLIGRNTRLDKVKAAYEEAQIVACVKEFEEKMSLAYLASDLMLARSGALTVIEQITFELPAIYVPLPWAADNHQMKNAEFVKNHIQAASIISQKQLGPESLLKELKDMMKNPQKISEIKSSLVAFKQSQISQDFSQLITSLLKKADI